MFGSFVSVTFPFQRRRHGTGPPQHMQSFGGLAAASACRVGGPLCVNDLPRGRAGGQPYQKKVTTSAVAVTATSPWFVSERVCARTSRFSTATTTSAVESAVNSSTTSPSNRA